MFCLVPHGKGVTPLTGNRRLELFTEERDLLMRFRDYIVQADVDVFTGWNICGFDWHYLFERAKHLGLDEWTRFSRNSKDRCTYPTKTFRDVRVLLDKRQLTLCSQSDFPLRRIEWRSL